MSDPIEFAADQIPKKHSLWRHHSRRLYVVVLITNEHTEHPDRYPVTVCYVGSNGRAWSKSLKRFHETMTRCADQRVIPNLEKTHEK